MIEFSSREQMNIWKAVKKELDNQGREYATAKIPLEKYPGFTLDVTIKHYSFPRDCKDFVEASVKLNDKHVCGRVSQSAFVTEHHLVVDECLKQFAERYNALERGERPKWCLTGQGGVDGLISQAEAMRALTSHIKEQSPQERPITKTKGQDFDR